MIDQLPWLLTELDARIQKMDRVPHGTIGRTRGSAADLNVMDFAACETARNARKAIRDLVHIINGPGPIHLQCTVRSDFIGPLRPAWRRLPYGYQPNTIELIDWLMRRIDVIARHKKAGHIYRELNTLVGSGHKGGELVKAIDRRDRHFAGPCPTIRGYDETGQPIECGHILYAEVGERTVDCPKCKEEINVEKTRDKALKSRDLMPAPTLLEAMTNVGDPVEESQLDRWIESRRLRPRGYLHQGEWVKTRVREDDQALYSFERARKLYRRDAQLARQKAAVR
ncbi:DUF1922 domain-containing protein [Mycolicibacterium mageritense]|uniref:DUF1922 domain-containing protein n=1 Tax=Mycolicibacterium mageritense TaxID=53462 RepID=UPI001E2FD669|nr:DUF1922 domain-containing protein [Mycolicibacterium mageritense]MCC9182585.1 DUF1922 domain-containing protein [Mycolicibacterium mageritense]